MTQNLWVSKSSKCILGGTFITKKAYLKKREKQQINNLNILIKQLEK